MAVTIFQWKCIHYAEAVLACLFIINILGQCGHNSASYASFFVRIPTLTFRKNGNEYTYIFVCVLCQVCYRLLHQGHQGHPSRFCTFLHCLCVCSSFLQWPQSFRCSLRLLCCHLLFVVKKTMFSVERMLIITYLCQFNEQVACCCAHVYFIHVHFNYPDNSIYSAEPSCYRLVDICEIRVWKMMVAFMYLLVYTFVPFVVIFKSTLHPLSQMLVLLICLFIAFTIASIPLDLPAIIMFSSGSDSYYYYYFASVAYVHYYYYYFLNLLLSCLWACCILEESNRCCQCGCSLPLLLSLWLQVFQLSLCCRLWCCMLFLEKECVLVTVCSHVSECPTATFAHIWVIHVSCHYFHNNFNSSFLSCNNFVLIYYTKIEKRLNICVYEFCVCLPFMVMFLRAPQPLLHTPALFMWMLVTLTMMVIAFFCLAITWFSSVQEAVFYIACL